MNEKVLWKIEELWKKYYQSRDKTTIDVSKNYENGVSKYYSPFHKVDNFHFHQSPEPVFTDDYGEYLGLERYQVLEKDNTLVYLFDNHNEMLYPLVEIFTATKHQYDIVHIDAHPDDAKFQAEKIQTLNLENVPDYIKKTRISDFFDAISETNIIQDIHLVTHSDSLEFFLPPKQPYILSLDIDIFGPEGDFAELKDKVRSIALAWGNADAVCIATSPGFIDQEYAQKIIEIFTKS